MAVINDNDDKMRDIIAQHAAALEDGTEVEPAEPVEEAEVPASEEEGETPEPVVEEEKPAEPAEPVEEEKPAVVAEGEEKPAKGAKPAVDAAAAAAAAKAKKPAEDAFEKLHGIKAKDKHGRENRIPHSVVAGRIVPNAIKAAKAEWETAELKPVTQKVALYEKRLTDMGEVERIQFEEPRRYLTMLTAIPGYKELFDEISGGKFTAGGEKQAKQDDGTVLAADKEDPEPQPDGKDDKGNVIGWTQDGLNKLRAWDRRQAAREATKATLAEVEKTYKPIADRFSAVTANEKVATDIDSIISVAAEWPGFTENASAILDELAKGNVPLDTPQKLFKATQTAYNTVMFGALGKVKETAEETRTRLFEEFQRELKKSPRSTAARTTVRREEPVVEEDNASPDDRMRNIIADSVRKAGLA